LRRRFPVNGTELDTNCPRDYFKEFLSSSV
jgi:hypothetical protein